MIDSDLCYVYRFGTCPPSDSIGNDFSYGILTKTSYEELSVLEDIAL